MNENETQWDLWIIGLIMLQNTWNLAPVDAYENYIVNS